MPTSPNPESIHPVETSAVALRAVCSYLANTLRSQLDDRVYDLARSVLHQGLLEQAAADLNFGGPVSHRSVKSVRTPVMKAFDTEFMLRIIDQRPVLISYVLRNGQPTATRINSTDDLGRLLSIQERCPVPSDPERIPQADLDNEPQRLVSITPLCGILHAVAWATDDTSGCVVVKADEHEIAALRADLQSWLAAEHEPTPERILAHKAFSRAA